MTLSLKIRHLFPLATYADFTLQDDGAGPYIFKWDEAKLGPRPTQAELDAVDATKIEHNARIDAQITALEIASGGYVRGLREFMLATATVIKQGNGPDFMLNVGMQKVKALDDQIAQLRKQRK